MNDVNNAVIYKNDYVLVHAEYLLAHKLQSQEDL